jgi:hypothetical protein
MHWPAPERRHTTVENLQWADNSQPNYVFYGHAPYNTSKSAFYSATGRINSQILLLCRPIGGEVAPQRDESSIRRLIERVKGSALSRPMLFCVDGLASYVSII